MKTKYNDLWLTKNTKAANAYMDEVAKESNFTGHHKGYTILPHKIHRCYLNAAYFEGMIQYYETSSWKVTKH